jgi:serine/threonine protein phosphatase 1
VGRSFVRFGDQGPPLRAPPATAPGERIYAIGDVHGRFDLLHELMKRIEIDARSRDACATRLVFLGDLIDRGPCSRELLEVVRRAHQEIDRITVLLGNHEDLLLESAYGSASAQRAWLENGGDATLRSFGVDPGELVDASADQIAATLFEAIGDRVITWLDSLPLHFKSGDYFFCHAGVRPKISLEKQQRKDLLWIRTKFLESTLYHGSVIVHGHSEVGDIAFHHNHINVDTAAYRTGVLTAVGLEATEQWSIQT